MFLYSFFILEFLPQKNRGKCMVGVTFCGALGAVFAGGMAWWLLEGHSWRTFVAACSTPAFIVGVLAFCLTEESPRFLFISGKTYRGKKVLQKMINEPLAWQGNYIQVMMATLRLSSINLTIYLSMKSIILFNHLQVITLCELFFLCTM